MSGKKIMIASGLIVIGTGALIGASGHDAAGMVVTIGGCIIILIAAVLPS